MGTARLTWYFDYVSPFSYLQLAACPELFERGDVALKPLAFGALLTHWGHRGPAEIPPKRLFTFRHVVFLARERGVPLRFPPAIPFNPLNALRLTLALGGGLAIVRTIFDFVWKEGRSPNDEWSALCERLGVADAEALCSAAEIKAALRANGETAIAAGVFGVPTFAVDGALFWGLDATPMLRAYLDDPALFDDSEMRRVSELPAAIQRKA